jgi:hypothetical protein
LVSNPIWGPRPHFCYRQTDTGLLMWEALSDERTVVIYNCCWTSPVQSFSGPSPARVMIIFYCLRFETPPTWRTRSVYLYPPRNRVARLYPQALGFLFFSVWGYNWATLFFRWSSLYSLRSCLLCRNLATAASFSYHATIRMHIHAVNCLNRGLNLKPNLLSRPPCPRIF